MSRAFKLNFTAIVLALSFVGPVAAGPEDDVAAAYARRDYATVLRLARPLADKGDAAAQDMLGTIYFNGLGGVSSNYAEALKWYRLSADQNNALAQYDLGFMYEVGAGVLKSGEEALKWFRLAADQSEPHALYALGTKYLVDEI